MKKISKINWLFFGLMGASLGALLLFVALTTYKLFVPRAPVAPAVVSLPTPAAASPANIKPIPTDSGKNPAVRVVATPSAFPVAPSNPTSSTGIPILMYHYVGNNPNPADRQRDILSITTDKLDEQFNWLAKNGYSPITLDTLYGIFSKKENISKPIVLTFDDGYIDFYYNAFQILRKYNFHAVSFIPTGLISTSYYMSWDQIKEINNSGLVSFQAHSVTHPNLPSLSYSRIQSELTDSKKTLEQQLGTHVNFIAYPFGASDPSVWQAALSAGFVGGVGTWAGKASGPGINMPRIRIAGTISLGEFIQKVRD